MLGAVVNNNSDGARASKEDAIRAAEKRKKARFKLIHQLGAWFRKNLSAISSVVLQLPYCLSKQELAKEFPQSLLQPLRVSFVVDWHQFHFLCLEMGMNQATFLWGCTPGTKI